ncbi:MAG TPA: DUF4129 domain-containing protein [Chloroflexota bacterium]|nr:DUF4129 domain-containing protein [Chloroflexota bacterium]
MSGYRWPRDGLPPAAAALLALPAYAWLSFALAPLFASRTAPYAGWMVGLLLVLPALAAPWLERRFPGGRISRRLLIALCVVLFALFIKTQAVPARGWLDWHWLVDCLFPWTSIEPVAGEGLLSIGWLAGLGLLAGGVWLGQADMEQEAVIGVFLGGLASFVVLLLALLPFAPPAGEQLEIGVLLGVYFCLGLAWQALAKRVRMVDAAFGGSVHGVGASWLVVFGGVGGSILLVALLLAGAGRPISAALGRLLLAIAVLVLSAVNAIWLGVDFLMNLLPSAHHTGPLVSTDHQDPLIAAVAGLKALGPASSLHVPAALWGTLLGLVATGIVAWAMAGLRHRGPRAESANGEQRRSVWSWALFLRQLRQLIRRSPTPRFPGAVARLAGAALPGRSGVVARRQRPTSVRALYLAVLWWCRQRGHPRRTWHTPLEFAPELEGLVPPTLSRDLTRAYVADRYGHQPASSTTFDALLSAWDEAQREDAAPAPAKPAAPIRQQPAASSRWRELE